MAEPDGKHRPQWIAWLVTAIIGMPLIYLLGVGPAIILSEKFPASEKFIGIVYEPMGWVAEKTPLRKPLLAYFRFWVEVAHKI